MTMEIKCPYCYRRSLGEENGTVAYRDQTLQLHYRKCPLCVGTQTVPVALAVAHNMLEEERRRKGMASKRLPIVIAEKLRTDYLKGDKNE